MLRACRKIVLVFLVASSLGLLCGAASSANPGEPLQLEATIALPNVWGRIDHMAIDLRRRRLMIAELGNDSVDVVDLSAGKIVHRITGLSEPQGVGYSDQADLVLVANAGDGSVRLFHAGNLAPAGTIRLGEDADNVRVDRRSGLVVVGYGSGGLALIDPISRTKVAEIGLPAHPESFRIGSNGDRAFVNMPDARQIAVVDLKARRVLGHWITDDLGANFPMAMDSAAGLLAVAFRSPPTLAMFDYGSGKLRSRAATCRDADDVFFDEQRQRIYVTCGSGEVAVFQFAGGSIRPLHSVATSPGARTSLFVPELDRLFVARRASSLGSDAAILIYRPMP